MYLDRFSPSKFAPKLLQSRTVLSLVGQMSGAAFGMSLRGRFDSGGTMCGMCDVKLLLHNWDNNIYSVPKHVFELPRLCDVNHGNRYSSLAIFRLHLFTLINSFNGHK